MFPKSIVSLRGSSNPSYKSSYHVGEFPIDSITKVVAYLNMLVDSVCSGVVESGTSLWGHQQEIQGNYN